METVAADELLCKIVEAVYVKSSLIRNLYAFELVVAILGAAVAVFMAVVIFRIKILHFNARLLLITQCFASAVSNIGMIFWGAFSCITGSTNS